MDWNWHYQKGYLIVKPLTLLWRDLFFFLGCLDVAIEDHNKRAKNKIDVERFKQFEEYCTKRFSTKKGVIIG